MALDLFGEVIITLDELYAWVHAIAPAYASSERSIERYIRQWNVADKVRRAKLDGTFESAMSRALDRRAVLKHRFRF